MTKRFGEPVADWTAARKPEAMPLAGRYVRLERLDEDAHAASLHAANGADDAIWDYLPYGPFATAEAYGNWVRDVSGLEDPFFFAIRDLDRESAPAGVASFLRITPDVGTIEIGHINLSPALQGRRAATEALSLMIGWAFDAGYRRVEWKCDSFNLPSRRAAARLGFSYEGTFRQATITKGRNRDTAWFAIIDKDWPAIRAAHAAWLDPGNFSPDGRQKTRLSDLTAPMLVARDPGTAG